MSETRYISFRVPEGDGYAVLDVEVPDAMYFTHHDLAGQHFLHLPRAVPLDQGHDWSIRDGHVRLSPVTRGSWIVLRYGPEPSCCGRHLGMGSEFCPYCGEPTQSIVEAS